MSSLPPLSKYRVGSQGHRFRKLQKRLVSVASVFLKMFSARSLMLLVTAALEAISISGLPLFMAVIVVL